MVSFHSVNHQILVHRINSDPIVGPTGHFPVSFCFRFITFNLHFSFQSVFDVAQLGAVLLQIAGDCQNLIKSFGDGSGKGSDRLKNESHFAIEFYKYFSFKCLYNLAIHSEGVFHFFIKNLWPSRGGGHNFL